MSGPPSFFGTYIELGNFALHGWCGWVSLMLFVGVLWNPRVCVSHFCLWRGCNKCVVSVVGRVTPSGLGTVGFGLISHNYPY